MRADIGMLFQENALFDSLTVAENVGYRLYEETRHARRRGARARRGGARVRRPRGIHRPHAVGAVGRSAAPRRHRARDGRRKPSLLLFDDPTTGLDPIIATTVDDEIVKLRDLEHVTSIVVTHQIRDAVLRRDARSGAAKRRAGDRGGRSTTSDQRAEFMVLHDGRIHFDGHAARSCWRLDDLPEGIPVHDAAALVTLSALFT